MSSAAYNATATCQQARAWTTELPRPVGAPAWASITQLLQQASVVASVDLIGFFSRYPLPRGTKRYLEKLIGEAIVVEKVRDKKTERLLGYIYRIPRPHQHLKEICDWMLDNGLTASWLHIAFDFSFADSMLAAHARSQLRDHLWIIRGAKGLRMVFKDTGNFYSLDTAGRAKPPRLFRVYVRPIALNILRIELILFRAATIRRYVRNPVEILDYDPRDIFENEFCLRFVKPSAVAKWEKEQLAMQERAIARGKVRRRLKHATGVLKRLANSRYLPTEIKRFNLSVDMDWALSMQLLSPHHTPRPPIPMTHQRLTNTP